MNPLRSLILAAAGNGSVRSLLTSAPVSRDVVSRYVAGEGTDDAVRTTAELVREGLAVTLDFLGEDVVDADGAEATVAAYLDLLDALGRAGLAGPAEVSVKLSAVGQSLDERLAADNAARICAAAARVGTTVTLDAEDHTTTDSTLCILGELRRTWPQTGAVLQAYLRRTLDDCRELAGAGSRVRLCKGAYAEPEAVAFVERHEVDVSYVRCANVLLAGQGYPMFATHDPRMVDIVSERASWHGREDGEFEYQMLYGIRANEQRRLAGEGAAVRVYLPYGSDWYGYLMRRLAERPQNVSFFLRSLVSTR